LDTDSQINPNRNLNTVTLTLIPKAQ